MRDLLHGLYKAKLALLALTLILLGLGLVTLAYWRAQPVDDGWLELQLLTTVGLTIFASGLLTVGFEYFVRKVNEARSKQELRDVLSDQAPAMRDAVIAGFAFQPDDLARVSSTATLDKIAENSLAIQLGDKELAADVYQDIRTQVLRAGERWEDVRVIVSLAPWRPAGTPLTLPLFAATIRWEYKVVPRSTVRRFACVSDLAEYREQLSQGDAASRVWRFREVAGLTGRSREAFELQQFTVDGQPCRIRRAIRARSQIYSVNLGQAGETGQPVTISYTYRALIERHGHLLHIDFDQPSRDVSIDLRYDGCGIRHVNVLDYLASGEGARVERSPRELTTQSVSVAVDGWTLPPAGVAFVWVLDSELTSERQASHGALTP